jgi:hypothetical protein
MELIVSLLADTNRELLSSTITSDLMPPPFLFDNNSSEINQLRDQQRRKKNRRNDYIEMVLLRYTAEEFRQNFRLRRSTFEVLYFSLWRSDSIVLKTIYYSSDTSSDCSATFTTIKILSSTNKSGKADFDDFVGAC